MKKFITIIITGIMLSNLLALQTATSYADTLKEETFSVGTFLDLDGNTKDPASGKDKTKNQEQKYFKDKNYSPAVSFALELLNLATKVIGSFAMVMLIATGFMFMVAQGNTQKIDEAKDMGKYVIFGLLATFFSYIIVIFVQGLFSAG